MSRRGFSLVELLVGLTLLSLFGGALHQLVRSLLHGAAILECASEAQESARIGIHLLVRDLRGTGYGPAGPRRPALRRAGPDRVGVASDWNGDGDTDDANERIEYLFDADARALLRAQGGAAPQPMLMDLAADGLALAYFDAAGGEIEPVDGAIADADLERIRRVDVRIAVEIAYGDSSGATAIRAEQTGSAFLRNG